LIGGKQQIEKEGGRIMSIISTNSDFLKNVIKTKNKHIAFGVNKEGVNVGGFAAAVIRRHWSELEDMCKQGLCKCDLGDVLTHVADDGHVYHALVCYSINEGFKNQKETIKQCFDNIELPNEEKGETITAVDFGRGILAKHLGADLNKIISGMEKSSKKICLAEPYTLQQIQTIINAEKELSKQVGPCL
jgi:hypothetical protein